VNGPESEAAEKEEGESNLPSCRDVALFEKREGGGKGFASCREEKNSH